MTYDKRVCVQPKKHIQQRGDRKGKQKQYLIFISVIENYQQVEHQTVGSQGSRSVAEEGPAVADPLPSRCTASTLPHYHVVLTLGEEQLVVGRAASSSHLASWFKSGQILNMVIHKNHPPTHQHIKSIWTPLTGMYERQVLKILAKYHGCCVNKPTF